MSSSISDAEIRRERNRLQRLSKRDPGVVYLGYRTGQLILRFEPPENGVCRACLTALSAPGLGETPTVFYHAVVHRRTDDGRRVKEREGFRHPFPALDWLHETVPDFDLLDTVCVNVPDEGSTHDGGSAATES